MKIHLDNSAFQLLSCDWKAQLRVIRGIKEPDNSAARFGSAVHKALEHLDKGISPQEMVPLMHKDTHEVDLPKAISLVNLFKLRKTLPPPIVINDKLAVELKFSYKYGSFIIPNSAELLEVYLEGTIDRMHLEDDILVITDYKTAGDATTYSMDKKVKSYSLTFQLPFYFFALLNFGILPASYLEYLLTGHYRLDIMLLFHNANPPEFRTFSRHSFSEDFIKREVPLIVNNKVAKFVELACLDTNAAHTGMTVYKACDDCGFRTPCLSMGTAKELEILSSFAVEEYNPLSFR